MIRILLHAALTVGVAALLGPMVAAQTSSSSKGQSKAAELIDLNSAAAEELATLPGVGEVTARKIIDGRPYKSLDDLAAAGVPAATIEKIRPLVTIKAPAASAKKAETPAAPSSEAKAATQPIDLNSATAEELETLPGVGSVTARRIIVSRPYQSINELAAAGVPAGTIEKIRPLVTVKPLSGTATKTKTAEPAKTSTAATPKATAAPPATGRIDLNTATAAELETLPGIGEATAQAIIAARPFRSVDDLDRVKGLGTSRIAALRDLVTVGAAATTPTTKAATPTTKAATPTTPTTKAATPTTGKKININTATLGELEALPLIGPVKAKAIMDARPFKSVEDINRVKGIGDVTFQKIKGLITVD
jgi:competence protein ComEA